MIRLLYRPETYGFDLTQCGQFQAAPPCGMPETSLEDRPLTCRQCARPLTYVRTIWRAFEPHIDVWACEPCQKIIRWPSIETKH